MNCTNISAETLNDFADGLLSGPEREAAERHLAECESCRAELSSILELRERAAALPRSIAPSRDLWSEIAGRIEEERVVALDSRRRRRLTGIPPVWLAAAAALLLIALSSGVTAYLIGGGQPAGTPDGYTAAPQTSPSASAGSAALVAFRPTEQEYEGAAEELMVELDSKRHLLSPETVEVIETNLRIIDEAIAESRAALEADPGNADLPGQLSDVHRKKVELLQHAVQLPVSI